MDSRKRVVSCEAGGRWSVEGQIANGNLLWEESHPFAISISEGVI